MLERAGQNPEGQLLIISVNLSARRFARPDLPRGDLVHPRKDRLRHRGPKPKVTERVTVGDVGSTPSTLKKPASLGDQEAIDDSGAGYSRLSYPRRVPVDTFEIDRSLVGRLEDDPESAAIVSATVDPPRSLGLEVAAEGVETATRLDSRSGGRPRAGPGLLPLRAGPTRGGSRSCFGQRSISYGVWLSALRRWAPSRVALREARSREAFWRRSACWPKGRTVPSGWPPRAERFRPRSSPPL